MNSSTRLLPIFPLHTVLYPAGELQLKVFERRYLDMVASVMKDDSLFGVISILEGPEVGRAATPATVGTLARISDWEALPGGLLGVQVTGEQRFRLLATEVQPDQLMIGTVQLLERGPALPIHEPYEVIVELLQSVAGPDLAIEDDADWVVDRLAGSIPLPLADRQMLLELDDPEDRLAYLYSRLQRMPSGQH